MYTQQNGRKGLSHDFLLPLSAMVFTSGILAGVNSWLLDKDGDFVSVPERGVVTAGAGILLSFLLNLIAWGLGTRSRRFGWTILAQGPFALLSMIGLLSILLEGICG